ncbi:sporulation initiation factor Spo0A C-terminal domain-containing protein [Lachnospiraceae bacterium 47-T17]
MTDFVRLMLVEDDPKILAGFRHALPGFPSMKIVFETGSETCALDYLEAHEADVVILDIELAEGDGLSFLDSVKARDLEKPFIVVVTNTGSNVILSYMREHGADYVYQKTNRSYSPEKILSILEKVYPYQKMIEGRKKDHLVERYNQKKADEITRAYVEGELERMGFRRKHVGFTYTADVLVILMKDKVGKLHITTDIYPLVAKAHHTTRGGVERGIRTAVDAVFTNAKIPEIQQYYPFPYDEERGRPTCTEFLWNMARRLQL